MKAFYFFGDRERPRDFKGDLAVRRDLDLIDPDEATRRAVAPGPAVVVGISEIEPKGAVVSEDAANLPEEPCYVFQVNLRRGLHPDLAGDLVIPEPPIRRAGHDAVHRLVR